ncbi:hypothetical protein PVAP13_6NG246006 [Panicum virgatum]|uniref:Uncharacterized protein n=1 Tax=Panicum virgatum TaxID=38727 RepID=A0A8T0R275_PANVG|nr:hypothetical protein PVAP13_6NG246006 [Panicum virgatum]
MRRCRRRRPGASTSRTRLAATSVAPFTAAPQRAADLVLSPKLFPLPDLLLFTHTFRDAEHGMVAERLPRRVASPTSLPLSSCISMAASPACRPVAQERRPHTQPTRVSPVGCSPAAAATAGHRPPVSVDTITFAWPRLVARPQRACMQPPWQRRPRHRRCRPRPRGPGHEPLTGGQSEPSRLTAAGAGEQVGWPTAARPPPAPPPRLATGRRSAWARLLPSFTPSSTKIH